MGHCTVTRGPLSMFLGLLISFAGGVSCQSGAGETPDADSASAAPSLKAIPQELRGAYSGEVNPRRPQPTGSPARAKAAQERWQQSSKPTTAQLILGDDPHLVVHGRGASKLVLIRSEPRTSSGRPVSDALVFRGQPIRGEETPRQVTVTPLPLPGVMEIVIDWGGDGGSHAGTLTRPVSLSGDGIAARFASYFTYADWRTMGPAAPAASADHTARLKRTLETLWKQERWRCLDGRNLIVRPGEPAELHLGQIATPRRYLIVCPDGGVAVRVHARRPVVLPPDGTMSHPAVEVTADLTRPFIRIHHHEDDPQRLLAAQAQNKPVTVTVLTLGNTRGDYGRLYPKEQAIADVAAPFVMAAGVAALVGAATSKPLPPGARSCSACHGTGQVPLISRAPNEDIGPGPFERATVFCPNCDGKGHVR